MIKYLQKMALPTAGMLWATFYFIEVTGKSPSAQVLIRPAYFLLALIYLLICRKEYKAQAAYPFSDRELFVPFVCLAVSALYAAAVYCLGFLAVTPVFLAVCFRRLGAERWLLIVSVAAVFTGALYYLFQTLLYVSLPAGILWGL